MSYQHYQHLQRGQWDQRKTSWLPEWNFSSPLQAVFYCALVVISGYCILERTDYFPLLPINELVWNILVYITPSSLVMALDGKTEEAEDNSQIGNVNYSDSRSFAAKSEAMRRILGVGRSTSFMGIPRPRAFSGVSSLLKSSSPFSLPGLGNWDNSCYQNSIIQGLASLPSVPLFLQQVDPDVWKSDDQSTTRALNGIISQLNDRENGGRRLWTPAALKSMSSWQQQDAQEYFSKIIDDIEKEAKLRLSAPRKHEGLRMIKRRADRLDEQIDGSTSPAAAQESEKALEEAVSDDDHISNPLEGLLAQRVGCLQCGYVEGLSLVPFNCITLPLDRSYANSVENCLDDFTQLERIDGVECGRCTLLRQEHDLKEFLTRDETPAMQALFTEFRARLAVVSQALLDDDYSENTIAKKCQIASKNRVTSTKTKQAVVARKPESLVLHINRSVFDEMTGTLSKNVSRLAFPEELDLENWSLGVGSGELEKWNMQPNISLLASEPGTGQLVSSRPPCNYLLRAVITHYGRHENGHYICYRRDPSDDEQWWRLSDDDVTPANLDEVLAQGGVFMLFYTRVHDADGPMSLLLPEAEAAPCDTTHQGWEVSTEEVAAGSKSLGDGTGINDPPVPHDDSVEPTAVHDPDTPAQPAKVGSGAGLPPLEDSEGTADASATHHDTQPDTTPETPSKDGESDDAPSVKGPTATLPAMRTSNSRSKKSQRRNRSGMTGMSNMVVAN